MAKRRSSIKGDFKLRGVLRRIAALGESDLPAAMKEAADLVEATQVQLVPKDTGAGAAAIKVKVSKNGLDARIGIIGKRDNARFFYLRFAEYGTKGYNGKLYQRQDSSKPGGTHTNNRDKSQLKGRRNAIRARATKNKSDGKTFFGRYPNIPARAARPWLRPSIDLNRDSIRKIIKAAIGRTLARATSGAGKDG